MWWQWVEMTVYWCRCPRSASRGGRSPAAVWERTVRAIVRRRAVHWASRLMTWQSDTVAIRIRWTGGRVRTATTPARRAATDLTTRYQWDRFICRGLPLASFLHRCHPTATRYSTVHINPHRLLTSVLLLSDIVLNGICPRVCLSAQKNWKTADMEIDVWMC